MRKAEKAEIVRDIQEKLAQAKIGILADFTGLQVEAMTQLRRQLKDSGGELKVVKNTLLHRAAADSPVAPLAAELAGPNALALGYADPVAMAKALIKFAQDKPLLKIRAGILAGQVLTAQEIDALSKLPSREVLMAQFLGLLQGVPTALVTVLAGVVRNLLNILVALKDQKEAAGGGAAATPAAGGAVTEAAAPEAPKEEAAPTEPPAEEKTEEKAE